MKFILCLAFGVVLAGGGALLWKAKSSASTQQAAADPLRAKYEGLVRNYYREDIESAKKQGKKEILLPGASDLPVAEASLEELLRNAGMLRVKVIDTETTVTATLPEIPIPDIQTWYKVEILETLNQQDKGSDDPPPFDLPGRFLPLRSSESLLVEQGGVVNVDGIAVVREVSTEGLVYIPNEEYLIVGYVDYGGKFISRTAGRDGVFHIRNNRLQSARREHRLAREIEERYGGDLDLLCSDIQRRQRRKK